MSKAIVGALFIIGVLHFLFVIVPLVNTARSNISVQSKLFWCAFLLFIPIVGAIVFHFRYRSGLLTGDPYEPTAHDLGATNPFNRDDL